MKVTITPPRLGEENLLAQIWYESWHIGHGDIAAPELTEARTFSAFSSRLPQTWDDMIVARCDDQPVGFASIKPGQIYQCFVSQEVQGSGIATHLLRAAEKMLAATGVGQGFLYCFIDNHRAAAFYRKMGWQADGTEWIKVEANGLYFDAQCILFRKEFR